MTRVIKSLKKIYCEGQREYYFIDQVLRITKNTKKFKHTNLIGGGSHEGIISKVINDFFAGEKICIVDNSNRAEGHIPLLENNIELLTNIKDKGIRLVLGKDQFDDEIIDFLGIAKATNKNSKESINHYLKNNSTKWEEFVKNKIKDKKYIISNLDKIKNQELKTLLQEIVDAHVEDNYN